VKLSQILNSIEPIQIARTTGQICDTGVQETDIASIHYRAQEVKAGGLFVAMSGSAADGHDFIDVALDQEAAAIVVQKEYRPDSSGARQAENNAFVIQVSNTREALAAISAEFYGNPSAQMVVVGITGTNGKTTTAYIIEGILQSAGYRVGVIGTINYRFAGQTFDNPITTPESLDLQSILAQMRNAGISHVVLEASSHAIDLCRIGHCWLDVAVFTNLTQDHLDFHGDMASYWSSKKRLFTEYLNTGPKRDRAHAVINCCHPQGRELSGMLDVPVVTVGRTGDHTVQMVTAHCDLSGINGSIQMPAGSFAFQSSLVGEHNVENILCAAGVGAALDLSPQDVNAGVQSVLNVPGRLEHIENETGRYVYVDYAHTPDALQNVIDALRAITTNRLICVFGCGGDRDKEKRPLMGEIAAKNCDLAVVTSDNPRTEEPQRIIDHILVGTKRINGRAYSSKMAAQSFSARGYAVEPDRKRAIELGIRVSQPGDAVLIAGKGHETYQILGKEAIAFDDRLEARRALARLEA
jgi:UDP-N-acetylmuramoyl-L-alanyl-D-glutamate--2,6-diaminopimelate ligase/murE/murF fusion protein